MDKYRPCPSIIAMFTSDSQHPPRSKHAVYLGAAVMGGIKQTRKGEKHDPVTFSNLIVAMNPIIMSSISLNPWF